MKSVIGHNPDILTCLANLSADEVFTPPKLAEAMLDLLPQELFRNPETTFLDPCCKSGVFLREIARRLNDGLRDQMPDEQKRVDHILTRQVFGLATSELTGALSRRSVYCSKKADGKFSVATQFSTFEGNIRLPQTKHRWDRNGRCEDCGASRAEYERGEQREAYAYPFIHGVDPKELFGVTFDVIVGNPPYHLDDGGHGRSASPIYHEFIEQAQKLEPSFLTMVIPSRWFAGGKGLEDFRHNMLNDRHLTKLAEYEDSSEVFPGVDIPGGICYFLWEGGREVEECLVTNIRGEERQTASRNLSQLEVFVRHPLSVGIIEKVRRHGLPSMAGQVSSRKPFGLPTTTRPREQGDLSLKWTGGIGRYPRSEVPAGLDLIDMWKVTASRATPGGGRPGSDGRRTVLSSLDVLPPGTICTEAYLVVGAYDSEVEARNLISYMQTRFFRFLLSQAIVSHDLTKEKYLFVPVLGLDRPWDDEALASKFELTESELKFIASKIRAWE